MLYFIINIYLLVLTRLYYFFFVITKLSKKEYIFQINKEVTSVIKDNKKNNEIKKVNLLLIMFFSIQLQKGRKRIAIILLETKTPK